MDFIKHRMLRERNFVMKDIILRGLLVVCLGLGGTTSTLAGDFSDKLGLGFSVQSLKLFGDTRNGVFTFGVNPAILRLNLKPFLFLEAELGVARLRSEVGGLRKTNLGHLGFKAAYRFNQFKTVTPLFYLGGGAFNFQLNDWPRYWDGYGVVGTGVELFLNQRLGINLTGDFRYTTGDDFDGADASKLKDGFVNLGVGLMIYFGDRYSAGAEPVLTPVQAEIAEPEEGLAEEDVARPDSHQVASAGAEEKADRAEVEKLLESSQAKEETIMLLRSKIDAVDNELAEYEAMAAERGVDLNTITASSGSDTKSFFLRRFQIALSLYEARNYSEAIKTLKSLVQSSAPQSIKARSWYWLGECHYAQEVYDSAMAAFESVLNSPLTHKREASLFMIGLCKLKSGLVEEARSDFERFLRNHPNSEFAPLSQYYVTKISS